MLIDSDASGLAKAHRDLGGGAHSIYAIAGDVSDAGIWVQARAGLDGVVPAWLVQCAGIAVSGSIADAPIEHWRQALHVNLIGIVLGCKTFARDTAHANKGHIIHIASRAAITAVPRFGPYVVPQPGRRLTNRQRTQLTSRVRGCPRLRSSGRMTGKPEFRVRSPAPRRSSLISRQARFSIASGLPTILPQPQNPISKQWKSLVQIEIRRFPIKRELIRGAVLEIWNKLPTPYGNLSEVSRL